MFRRGLRGPNYRPTPWEKLRLAEEAAEERRARVVERMRNEMELAQPKVWLAGFSSDQR